MTNEQQGLRRLMAEVMGYKYLGDDDVGYGYYWEEENPDGLLHGFISEEDWNPLKDANQALMLIEKMRELGFAFKVWAYNIGDYTAIFMPDSDTTAHIKVSEAKNYNFCAAICHAVKAAWEAMKEGK